MGQKTIFATLLKFTELHASLYQWTINEAWCAFQAVSGKTHLIRVDLPTIPLSNAERETILPHTKFHTRHQRTRGYSQKRWMDNYPLTPDENNRQWSTVIVKLPANILTLRIRDLKRDKCIITSEREYWTEKLHTRKEVPIISQRCFSWFCKGTDEQLS